MTDRSQGSPRGEHRTLRATSTLVAFWAVVGISAFLVGDAAFRGAWGFVGRWLPLVLFIVWAFWVMLWRSSIRVERERVVVTNLLRVHVVPWPRVAQVVQGPQIRLEMHDGTRLDCWGGPFPPRPALRGGGRENTAVDLMESARESSPRSTEKPLTYWDVPVLIVGCILLGWAALAVTIMRP